jgi:hypothetical protein
MLNSANADLWTLIHANNFDYWRHAQLVGLMLALSMPAAMAQENAIYVELSTAKVLRLDRSIRDVIPGDKDIADVAVQGDRTLVVTGKKEGKTNVIVFDVLGKEILNSDIIVAHNRAPRYYVWVVPRTGKGGTLTTSSVWDCFPGKLCNFVKESEVVAPTQVSRSYSKQDINQNIQQNSSGASPNPPPSQ